MQTLLESQQACYFCVEGLEIIDYKNTNLLQKFISYYAKILPRRRTHTCSKHQRKLASAIKRARIMALLPFTNRHA